MTPEVVPERPPDPGETRTATHATKVPEFVPANRFGWVADLFLIGMFLSLAFLLGAFPLKDVDQLGIRARGSRRPQPGEMRAHLPGARAACDREARRLANLGNALGVDARAHGA